MDVCYSYGWMGIIFSTIYSYPQKASPAYRSHTGASGQSEMPGQVYDLPMCVRKISGERAERHLRTYFGRLLGAAPNPLNILYIYKRIINLSKSLIRLYKSLIIHINPAFPYIYLIVSKRIIIRSLILV